MKKHIFIIFMIALTTHSVFGIDRPKISAVGVSAKGQYIAIEEYGLNAFEKKYYTRLRIINLWKKQDVIEPMEWKIDAHASTNLQQIRFQLKKYAQPLVEQYGLRNRYSSTVAQD